MNMTLANPAPNIARWLGAGALWGVVVAAALGLSVPARAQTGTLEQYLLAAAANSPAVGDLGYQLGMLGIDSAEVHARQRPQVDGTGQVLYAPSGAHWGYDPAITNGGLYAAMVGASVPLFAGNRLQSALDSVGVQNLVLRAVLQDTLLELGRRITEQYISAYADQRALQLAQERLRLMAVEDTVITRLTAHGIYQQTDVLGLRVNLHAQQITAAQAEAQLHKDLRLLYALCGIQETALTELAPPGLTPSAAFDPANTPRMQRSVADSLVNAVADRRVDLYYRAQLRAVGDAGLNAITIGDIPNRFGASAGLNLQVPIFDGGRRKLEHQRVALKEATRKGYRDFLSEQLLQRHALLMDAAVRADSLVADYRRQYAEEEQLINLYRVELGQALVRPTDLFLTLNDHARTADAMVQAEADRERTLNELIHLQ